MVKCNIPVPVLGSTCALEEGHKGIHKNESYISAESELKQMKTNKKIIPRNDFVLLISVDKGTSEGGVAYPDISAQGKEWFVSALGPKVEDLEVGDQVEVMGAIGEDVAILPREKNLFITKQANILLRYSK